MRAPPGPAITSAVRTFFEGRAEALRCYRAVAKALGAVAPTTPRVTKSQIALRARRGGRDFAWVWTPDRWLHGDTAPLVLSIALARHDASPRWKEVAHPTAARWMHHLEVWCPRDIDAEVVGWLREACETAAGESSTSS